MFFQIKMFFSIHKKLIFIILLSIITVALIIVAGLVIAFRNKGSYKTTKYISVNKDFSITLQDNLEMDLSNKSGYKLYITSIDKNVKNIIAVSTTDLNPLYTMEELVNADKTNYVSEFENSSNVSETFITTVKGKSCYNYSFDTDSSYIEVYWINANNTYYVFDFACDKKSPVNLKANITNILNTLEFTSDSSK